VHLYLLQGMIEQQIATKMQVSRATVTRDIKKIREDNSDWIDNLASKNGIITELKFTVERLTSSIYRLHQLLKEAKTVSEKIQIERTLVGIYAKMYELQTQYPLVQSFKNFIQQNVIDNPVMRTNRPMPVFPSEVDEFIKLKEKREKEERKK